MMSEQKIMLKEKASFALANLGNIPIMGLIGAYLMIFYTDVVGLDPAAVATLFLIARVLDGISDPLMGYLIDHLPRTRLGRFRTYLLIGVVICSINYALLWFGPAWIPSGKLTVAFITYLLIGLTFDLMDIPLNSLIPVMTADEKERASLSTIKGLSYMLGTVVISVGAPLIIAEMGQVVEAYYILVFAALTVVLTCTIVGVKGVRERIEPIKDEKYSVKELFKIIAMRPILTTFLATLLFGVAGSLSGTSNIYFATYVLDNQVEILSLVTICSVAGMIPAAALSKLVLSKIGKKNLMVLALGIGVSSQLLRLANVTSIPLWLAAGVIMGIAQGFAMVLLYSISADNVDYVEYTGGWRAEGGIASLYSFIMKSGGGIGGAIAGYVMAATGYVPNQAQTELARTGIVLNVIVFPAALFFIAMLLFAFGYNINRRKMDEITNALTERREASRG